MPQTDGVTSTSAPEAVVETTEVTPTSETGGETVETTTATETEISENKTPPNVEGTSFTKDQVSKIVQKRINEINAKHNEEMQAAKYFISEYYNKYGDIRQPQVQKPAYTAEQVETIKKAREAIGAVDKDELKEITSQYDQKLAVFEAQQQAMQGAYINKGNSQLAAWAKERGITDENAVLALGSAVAGIVKSNPDMLQKFQSGLFTMDTSYLKDALDVLDKNLFAKRDIKTQVQTATELAKRGKTLPAGLPKGGGDFPAKTPKKMTPEERQEAAFLAFQKFGEVKQPGQ